MSLAHKNYWFWVAVIVVAGIFVFFVRFQLPEPTAALVIDFNNGQVRKFEGKVESGMTFVEALYSSSLGGKFDFRYYIDKDGNVNLYSLSGNSDIGEREWHFYSNGRLIETQDLNRVRVKEGDLIEAKYE